MTDKTIKEVRILPIAGGRCFKVQYVYGTNIEAVDVDTIPEYKPEQPYIGTFRGKRIRRGLYKTKDRTIINADINDVANIFRKSKQNFCFEELCRGLFASPQRMSRIYSIILMRISSQTTKLLIYE